MKCTNCRVSHDERAFEYLDEGKQKKLTECLFCRYNPKRSLGTVTFLLFGLLYSSSYYFYSISIAPKLSIYIFFICTLYASFWISTFIHEIGHAVGCLLVRYKIKAIVVGDIDKGKRFNVFGIMIIFSSKLKHGLVYHDYGENHSKTKCFIVTLLGPLFNLITFIILFFLFLDMSSYKHNLIETILLGVIAFISLFFFFINIWPFKTKEDNRDGLVRDGITLRELLTKDDYFQSIHKDRLRCEYIKLHNDGEYIKAKKIADELYSSSDRNVFDKFNYALSLLQSEEFYRSEMLYIELLENSVDERFKGVIYNNLACIEFEYLLQGKGDIEKCEKYIYESTKYLNNIINPLLIWCRLAYHREEYDLALDYFDFLQAPEEGKELISGYYIYKGLTQLQLNMKSEGEQNIKKGIGIFPNTSLIKKLELEKFAV